MVSFVPRDRQAADDFTLPGFPGWFARLLRLRGVRSADEADRYLHPRMEDLTDPFNMAGMAETTRLLTNAAEKGERIAVFGDYDTDGICASALLSEALTFLGAHFTIRLPDRQSEGYGLNVTAVRELAASHRVLLTADCGITGHAETALAKELGMTVIITDHHQPPEISPAADAILHPAYSPFPHLCGAGVAFQLCRALMGNAALPLLPLCALATIADIVPLTGDNRVMAAQGLRMLEKTESEGLLALIRECGMKPPFTAHHLAFQLSPRINAAGRLADPRLSLDLLLTRDPKEASRIADQLSDLNTRRRTMQNELVRSALAAIPEQADFKTDNAIVIALEGVNPGLLGLCAGVLSNQYHFPSIVLTEHEDGLLTGSARSIPGVDIHAALRDCSDLMVKFGGHAQAAGLTLSRDNLPELKVRLSDAIARISDPQCFIDAKTYDIAMPLTDITEETARLLTLLEPVGNGNPEPVFLSSGLSAQDVRAVGKTGDHLALTLAQGDCARRAIFFSHGQEAGGLPDYMDVLYTPVINEYMGTRETRLTLSAIQEDKNHMTLPNEDAFADALLKDLSAWTTNDFEAGRLPDIRRFDGSLHGDFAKNARGDLVIARTRATALRYADALPVINGGTDDPRGYSALLVCPELERLNDSYRRILLADGLVTDREASVLRKRCNAAAIYAPEAPSGALTALLRTAIPDDRELRDVYKILVSTQGNSADELCRALGMSRARFEYILKVFGQLDLLAYNGSAIRLLPPVKRSLSESPLIREPRKTAFFSGKEQLC